MQVAQIVQCLQKWNPKQTKLSGAGQQALSTLPLWVTPLVFLPGLLPRIVPKIELGRRRLAATCSTGFGAAADREPPPLKGDPPASTWQEAHSAHVQAP